MSWIVNASGTPAAPWMGKRSGASSTKRRKRAALFGKAVPPFRYRHGRRQSNGPPSTAPVVNYRVATVRAGLLEQDGHS